MAQSDMVDSGMRANEDEGGLYVRTEPSPLSVDGKIILCLSGGGFRSMLFHCGALLRLVELGLFRAGAVHQISSVSGGSLLNGLIAVHWKAIAGGDPVVFRREIIDRARRVSTVAVDVRAVLSSQINPSQPARVVAALYESPMWPGPDGHAEVLLPRMPLSELPDPADSLIPRFLFNATDLNSGRRWTFSRAAVGAREHEQMMPVRVRTLRQKGAWPNVPGCETLTLAEAVAASGAFPPVLSPLHVDLRLPDGSVETHSLVDGGVHDNLGLDSVKAYDNVLISDAGGTFDRESRVGFRLGPLFIPAQLPRVFNVVDGRSRSQVREWVWQVLRNLVALPQTERSAARQIAYWPMDDSTMREELSPPDPASGRVNDYELRQDGAALVAMLAAPVDPPSIRVHPNMAARLARVPTRLAPISPGLAKQLINLGYARCDHYVRTMAAGLLERLAVQPSAPSLPFPEAPVDIDPGELAAPPPPFEVRAVYLLIALGVLWLTTIGVLTAWLTALLVRAGWSVAGGVLVALTLTVLAGLGAGALALWLLVRGRLFRAQPAVGAA